GNDFQSFPSGHVVGAVLLYGFLFLLAGKLDSRPLRWSARAFCLGVILTSGYSRIWLGHHWVGDVLAAYTFGGLVLLGVVVAYRAMEPTFTGLPFVHSAPVPHDDALPHAHALTSTILFRDGRVLKIYNPGFVPRLAYWLSFQAPFGYAHNPLALEAAVYRRNLAGLLTEYWYGSNRVSPAYGMTTVDGRLALEGHYTEGVEPTDHHAARAYLFDLAARFDAAGLPTWQIDPRQPRSLGNLLETAPGEYTVIDLESGMVSPLQSPRAWWRGIRRSTVPLYDDVFFDVTRAYVDREREMMRATLGDAWLANLESTLAAAESTGTRWHASEPRLWSRFARAFWSGFGVRTFPGWIRAKAEHGRDRAGEWITIEIDRWEEEGRFTPEEADKARIQLADPGVQEVLPHFGVHLLIGVALRFPFGSVARVTYVTGNFLLANLRFALRRIDRRKWRRELSIHSPLVILIAAMPGIGTSSYLASGPLLANRSILRVALDAVGEKFPGQVYRRTGLRRIIAKPAHHRAEVVQQ
ncbi:MAG: phosphatase PAP2 family protein, partial [Tepidiformaceae bacterium]